MSASPVPPKSNSGFHHGHHHEVASIPLGEVNRESCSEMEYAGRLANMLLVIEMSRLVE